MRFLSSCSLLLDASVDDTSFTIRLAHPKKANVNALFYYIKFTQTTSLHKVAPSFPGIDF
jgi:hypothetical protein